MATQRWTEYDARMGFCLKSEVGTGYEQGTRPTAPIYWTQGAYSRGECLLEEVGTRIDADPPPPPDASSEDGFDESSFADFVDPSQLTTDEQRNFQLTQLYKAVHVLQPEIQKGGRLAMETMVKLQARIASISGLDQPRMKENPSRPTMADIARLTDAELEQIARGRLAVRYVDEAGKVARTTSEEAE